MKAWNPDLVYGAGDFATHIGCIKRWQKAKKCRPSVSWRLPQRGTIKWNTDGASKGNPGHAGIGGLLHDEKGKRLCSFSSYIGVAGASKAEFTALVKAVEITAQNGRCQGKEMLIECDSTTAVSWTTKFHGV